MSEKPQTPAKPPKGPSLFGLLKPYRGLVFGLIALTVVANGLTLWLPKITADAIDDYATGTFVLAPVLLTFGIATVLIFIFAYAQNIVQTYAAERVARDLRTRLSSAISLHSNAYVQQTTSALLLTNLTSDVEGVKTFVSQAIAAIIASLFLIVGSSILLLLTDWRLALAVLVIIPIISGTFFTVFRQVRKLFKSRQEVIDWLNRVINESILGAALIRVLYSQQTEFEKFREANLKARDTGMQILRLFASMIPIVMFVSNSATVIILALGGHFVIGGSMTLGTFAAFNGYLAILIFPIFVLGFMSNVIAQASASYTRIAAVLDAKPEPETGTLTTDLKGNISVRDLTLRFGEKEALKNVSFDIKGGQKTAIIGPTAAGKTQLLAVLTGLIKPTSGVIEYDGKPLAEYEKEAFHRQVGLVFQDSIIFSLPLRENIAFSETVTEEAMRKAIDAAELQEFITALPNGLETVVSERGTSLSGGQKQRIMLARALALNPRILFLDDFTARVDTQTEAKILKNIETSYPGLTLVSVTQKIEAAERCDQVIVLMEGEMLAAGTHAQLMETSPEYAQIAQSQRSTNTL